MRRYIYAVFRLSKNLSTMYKGNATEENSGGISFHVYHKGLKGSFNGESL